MKLCTSMLSLLFCLVNLYSFAMEKQPQANTDVKDLKILSCANFFKQASTIAAGCLAQRREKHSLPEEVFSYLGNYALEETSAEYGRVVLREMPQSLCTSLGLSIMCNDTMPHDQKKLFLQDLCVKSEQETDKLILNFFAICSESGGNFTKEALFERSLSEKAPLCVSQFFLGNGVDPDQYSIEAILERRSESEYGMEQPVEVRELLDNQNIKDHHSTFIQFLKSTLAEGQYCNEEAVKYDYVYTIYNKIFINQLEQLISLGFKPQQEGFNPVLWKRQNVQESISAFNFLMRSARDWRENYARINCAYARYMITVWDQPDVHDYNKKFFHHIRRFYRNSPMNEDFLTFLGDNFYYKEHLITFETITYHYQKFCYRALKRLKQFYPEEFAAVKNKRKK